MSVKLDDTIYLHFGTASASTGAATDADSTPTVTIEEDGTAMGYGPTVTNVATGLYRVTIACTTANGFEAGKRYSAYAVATVSTVTGRDGIGEFLVESAVVDDVYGRIGAPAGASIAADLVVIDNFVDDLESRVIGTIATGTHNPQSGDAYARLGAPAGASIAADLVVIDDFVDALEIRCTELRLAELDSGNLPTDIANIYNRIGAPAGASIAADLVVIDDFVDALETRCTEARLAELDAANIPADIDTLLTRISALRAGYIDNLSGGAVALAAELSKVLGASAGKKVISADGLQVEVYDESDVLLVTLDRTGAGPYTWTPTWE